MGNFVLHFVLHSFTEIRKYATNSLNSPKYNKRKMPVLSGYLGNGRKRAFFKNMLYGFESRLVL